MGWLTNIRVKVGKEIIGLQKQAVEIEAKRSASGDLAPELEARLLKIHGEETRIAHEIGGPIAKELEELSNKVVAFGKQRVEEETVSANHQMSAAERSSLILGIVVAFVMIGACALSVFLIARPIQSLTRAMRELASGNFSVVLPGLGRKDEIGDIAGAVEDFKVKAEEKAREEAEAKIKQDKIAAEQRKADMHRLADGFEAAVGEIIDTVSSASTELEASATTLTSTAERGAGACHHGRRRLGGGFHQRAVGRFRHRRAVVVDHRDQPPGAGVGADGERSRRPGAQTRPIASASCRRPRPGSATSSS